MADPLRVLHLITGLGEGGAEMVLHHLVCAMDPRRFENRVVSMMNGGAIAERLVSHGIQVGELGMRAGVPSLAGWTRWKTILRRFRPQVVQTWMYHANLLGSLAMGDLPETRLVWSLHHSNLSWRMNKPQTLLIVRIGAMLSRRAPQAIVCCSEAARRAHDSIGYDARKLLVIPNGCNTALFRPDAEAGVLLRRELGIPQASPVIALVARFHPQKNHRGFIEAAALVHRSRPDAHFVLCGAGIVPRNAMLAEWIARRGLAHRFHLLGPVSDVRRIMAGATVVASSSAGEGMSCVIGEAMACGTVCVVTDVGDSARMIGDAGIVVPANAAEALAEGLLTALRLGPEARRGLRTAARRRIEGEYGLSRTVDAYQQLYEQVANYPSQFMAARRAS